MACRLLTASKICTAFGLVVLLAGLIVPGLILKALQNGIKDHVVISPGTTTFDDWVNDTRSDAPSTWLSVKFFNVTNKADVVAKGAVPVVAETATYVYRAYTIYYDVEFSPDLEQVGYFQYKYYVFNASMSDPGADPNALVTSAWPTFAALLDQAGGSTQDAVAGLAGQLVGGMYTALYALTVNQTAYAYAQWGSLAGVPLFAAPNVSIVTAPIYVLALNLTSQVFADAVVTVWKQDFIFPEFAAWTAFNPEAGPFAGMTLPADVVGVLLDSGACPLFSGAVPGTGPMSGVPCAAALMSLASSPAAANSTAAQELFPMGPDPASALSLTRRLAVGAYLGATAGALATFVATDNTGADSLESALWVSRTPTEWLFSFNDPLLALLRIGSDPKTQPFNSAFFPGNLSDPVAAKAFDPTMTWQLTGTSNAEEALQYQKWKNVSVLAPRPDQNPRAGGSSAFWCGGPVNVLGQDDTQFPMGHSDWWSWVPGVSLDELYPVFIDQIYRPADFEFYSNFVVKGITVDRFHLADSSFAVNETFSTYYPGLLNMTCPEGGPAIMVTLPHFLRCDAPSEWLVEGVPPPVPLLDETFLDVDRVSGATIQGYKRLQINLLLANNTQGLNGTRLLPILALEQRTELTDDQASKYRSQVTDTLNLATTLRMTLCVIGGFVFCLALMALIVATRQRSAKRDAGTVQADEALLRPEEGYTADLTDSNSTAYL